MSWGSYAWGSAPWGGASGGALRTEYEGRAKTFEKLLHIAKFVLTEEIKRKKIEIHSIPSRIKSLDSLLLKVQRKEIKDPFTEIRDIVGLRVVYLFLDDLQKIANIIKTSFEVIEEENIIADTCADIFRYYLPQFKVKLKNTSTHGSEYEEVRAIPFEIQIRTIAQEAWASISHHLDYKQELGVPIPNHMKRDFHALNGLFYVADTHFVMIRKELYKELESSKLK